MSRTLYVVVDLTVPNDADDQAVADFVLDALCARGGDDDPTPYESCDGTEWERIQP